MGLAIVDDSGLQVDPQGLTVGNFLALFYSGVHDNMPLLFLQKLVEL